MSPRAAASREEWQQGCAGASQSNTKRCFQFVDTAAGSCFQFLPTVPPVTQGLEVRGSTNS